MPTSPEIRTRVLSPALRDDFLRFFDGDAFADNPKWSFCYCQCFYEDHAVVRWAERTADENRGRAVHRIAHGDMRGMLAYVDDTVVGWCNAGPTRIFAAIDAPPPDAERLGQILCFLVAPAWRGKGVAKALLAAACEDLAAQGMTEVEANPRPHAKTTAEQHFGPLSLYLSAGFHIDRHDTDGSVYVRKRL